MMKIMKKRVRLDMYNHIKRMNVNGIGGREFCENELIRAKSGGRPHKK